MRIAIIGSQGIPSNYGGFETLVENLTSMKHSPSINYTVFCSKCDCNSEIKKYNGADLRYIPFHANGFQSAVYDICSMICCLGKSYEVVLILGVSGCIFLPFFRLIFHGKIIVNIDGIEHKRGKWGVFARWFLRISEKIAVKSADVIIADNKGIYDYVSEIYGNKPTIIAYGGNHAIRKLSEVKSREILTHYGLTPFGYSIAVCRIEPENNCHIILEAFSQSDRRLVFVGNWSHSEYGKTLRERFKENRNIFMLDPIYDLDSLFVLRSNADMYIHGHSAGGTNPSLVEAMHIGIPVIAFDVIYNRFTTNGKAFYFKDKDDLMHIISAKESFVEVSSEMKRIAEKNYTWDKIIRQYEELFFSLDS